MKMTQWTICILLGISILVSQSTYGQTDTASSKMGISLHDQTTLTYFYVGDGCPFCNIDHPEMKYGFRIECVGCHVTKDIEDNNFKVAQTLDKKYGSGWTEKFIRSYCDKMDN